MTTKLFVQHPHMFNQPISMGPGIVASVNGEGQVIGVFPEEVLNRCRMIPTVFRFEDVEDEQLPAPAGPPPEMLQASSPVTAESLAPKTTTPSAPVMLGLKGKKK